jgi:hypothetical protein
MNEFIKILPAVVGIAYIIKHVAFRWNELMHPPPKVAIEELEIKTVQSWIDGRKIPFTHYTFYKIYLDNQGIPNPIAIQFGHERRFGDALSSKFVNENFASEAFNEDMLKAASEYLADRWCYTNFLN